MLAAMDDLLDIQEVVRRTGLTSRTLRFYEARGLVKPLRTHKNRRLYGSGALERINQIVTLKRAGLTLAQIQELIARDPPDLARLIDAQLPALFARQAEIAEALKLLISVDARIGRGESVDAATFCDLIRQGDSAAQSEDWRKEMISGLVGQEQFAYGIGRMSAVIAGLDPKAHKRDVAELAGRIEAALPLDPDSAKARALYDEWQSLCEPLMAVGRPGPVEKLATAESVREAVRRIDEWNRESKVPVPMKVFQFLFAAGRRRGREAKKGG